MKQLSRPARFVALFALLQFAFVYLYLKSEHAIQFWDYAMYANMALAWVDQNGIAPFVMAFAQSFAQKYNLLFAVPSAVTFSLFGGSRDVFILTNFAFFFLAHEAAIALVLRRLFALPWPVAMLWALGLCTAIPFMWYPLLEGYPDNGAAACLVFALGVSLRDKKSWRQAIAVGVLLGLSIILRRHYAYPALALLVTLGGFDLFSFVRRAAVRSAKRFWLLALYYISVVFALIGLMLVVEPSYFAEMLTTSYATLYKSYERTPSYFMLFCLSRLGLVLLVTALTGYASLMREKKKTREPVLRIAGVGLVWLLIWAFGPAQAGEHYLISIAPVFCAVGLYGAFVNVWCTNAFRWPARVCAVLLAVNALQAFWFAPFVLPDRAPSVALFSTPRPPWSRSDYDELLALSRYIGETTTNRDRVVLAGSSFVLNQDLLRSVYVDIFKDLAPAFRYLAAPESDGEQEPPLDVFAQANVYIVASPAQYHLAPEGQKVVTGLVNRFPPDVRAAPLFEKDERTFHLMNDVSVSIWRRKKEWPPAMLHEQLAEIRKIKDTGKLWVTEQTTGIVDFMRTAAQGDVYIINHAPRLGSTKLFLDQPVGNGTYRIGMLLNATPSCENVSFSVRAESEEGKSVATKPSSPAQTVGAFYIPFHIEGKSEVPRFVSLSLTTTSMAPCTVALWQLRLEQMAP